MEQQPKRRKMLNNYDNMLYTDGNIMYGDTLPELLRFARAMGMSEAWLKGEQTDRPYFIIIGNARKLIMREVSGNRVKYVKAQGTAQQTKQTTQTA